MRPSRLVLPLAALLLAACAEPEAEPAVAETPPPAGTAVPAAGAVDAVRAQAAQAEADLARRAAEVEAASHDSTTAH